MQAVKLFWRLLGEIQSGTLEQVYLSPLPSWLVAAAGRAVAALIETLIVMAMTYGIVSAFVTLHYHWTAAALPVIAVPGWFAGLGGLFPATATVASLYGTMIGHHGVTKLLGTGCWSPPPPARAVIEHHGFAAPVLAPSAGR
jgi:ABC-2 type transport system permease protein